MFLSVRCLICLTIVLWFCAYTVCWWSAHYPSHFECEVPSASLWQLWFFSTKVKSPCPLCIKILIYQRLGSRFPWKPLRLLIISAWIGAADMIYGTFSLVIKNPLCKDWSIIYYENQNWQYIQVKVVQQKKLSMFCVYLIELWFQSMKRQSEWKDTGNGDCYPVRSDKETLPLFESFFFNNYISGIVSLYCSYLLHMLLFSSILHMLQCLTFFPWGLSSIW